MKNGLFFCKKFSNCAEAAAAAKGNLRLCWGCKNFHSECRLRFRSNNLQLAVESEVTFGNNRFMPRQWKKQISYASLNILLDLKKKALSNLLKAQPEWNALHTQQFAHSSPNNWVDSACIVEIGGQMRSGISPHVYHQRTHPWDTGQTFGTA